MVMSTPGEHLFRDLIQPQANGLARGILTHSNSVDYIRRLNGIPVMGYKDKLDILDEVAVVVVYLFSGV